MFSDKRILAVIPARGGSKGLPGKNIRPLSGKPLIAWTIEAALASRYIDRTIVSTDCVDIRSAALAASVEVPFLRPAELATDSANSVDAVLHALDQVEKTDQAYDYLLLLQPTSPLRRSEDIDAAIEKLTDPEITAVISVCETDHHPWWSNKLPENGNMDGFLRSEALNIPRQQLPHYYQLNGAIYLSKTDFLRRTRSFWGAGTFAHIMDKRHSIDIDDIYDFKFAELLLKS